LGSLQGRNLDFVPQGRLGEADRHLGDNVDALPHKGGMRPHPHIEIQISRRSAPQTRFTLAAEPDAVAVVHTGRDLDTDSAPALNPSRAVTLAAGRCGKLARAAAAGTGGDGNELSKGGRSGLPHLAAAAALGAHLDGRARLRSVAAAAGTHLHPGHFDGLVGAKGGFLEVHLDLHLQVPAPHRSPGPLPPAAAGEHVEDVKDVPKGVKTARTPKAPRSKGPKTAGPGAVGPAKGVVAKSVVLLPGLGIAQDAVGLVDLLELFLGL